jgi:hypothetical protein
MSPDVASPAARQERHSGTALVLVDLVDPDTTARCSLRCVLNVVPTHRYHSSHEKTDQCIAAIATIKTKGTVAGNLTTNVHRRPGLLLASDASKSIAGVTRKPLVSEKERPLENICGQSVT